MRTGSVISWGALLWSPMFFTGEGGCSRYDTLLYGVIFVYILFSLVLKYRSFSMVPYRGWINFKGRNALACLRGTWLSWRSPPGCIGRHIAASCLCLQCRMLVILVDNLSTCPRVSIHFQKRLPSRKWDCDYEWSIGFAPQGHKCRICIREAVVSPCQP